MNIKQLQRQAISSIIKLILTSIVLSVSTYAWLLTK